MLSPLWLLHLGRGKLQELDKLPTYDTVHPVDGGRVVRVSHLWTGEVATWVHRRQRFIPAVQADAIEEEVARFVSMG